MAYDEVEVSTNRACLGRLYFHVPGGIKYGQHWLNVKSPNECRATRTALRESSTDGRVEAAVAAAPGDGQAALFVLS